MTTPKKRILCVEDDADTCELLALALPDYEVVTVSTIAEALPLAKSDWFVLYLLDNWLPDGSGVELCRRLRRFDKRTPVLFFSAAVRERDHQEALAAGAQAYLDKPADLDTLRQTIERLLDEATTTTPGE